ncbi:MAG: GNAT family N-acetyltransferase [Treponemataceae bacterium]
MQDFSIRKATIEDLKDIYRVEIQSFEDGICEEKSIFAQRIEVFADGFLLLLKDKKIIGYFASELWQSPLTKNNFEIKNFMLGHSPRETHVKNGNSLYLSSMGILPEFRGSGLGVQFFTECMNFVTQENPSIQQQILLVNENWHPARAIYAKAGFTQVCVFENFFEAAGKKSAGIVMKKRL